MPKATLLVIQGADQGLRFELDGGEVTLGRDALNPIRLRDDEVSRFSLGVCIYTFLSCLIN